MSYGSERHRRKVMREMRLAGYDLPGTPYRRVNRKFKYKNKRTGVSTAKVKTSQKIMTGKRSSNIMFQKYNFVSEEQRKKVMQKLKDEGRYDPYKDPSTPQYKRLHKKLYGIGLKDASKDVLKIAQDAAQKIGDKKKNEAKAKFRKDHDKELQSVFDRHSKKVLRDMDKEPVHVRIDGKDCWKTWSELKHYPQGSCELIDVKLPTGNDFSVRILKSAEDDPEFNKLVKQEHEVGHKAGRSEYSRFVKQEVHDHLEKKVYPKIRGETIRKMRKNEYKDSEIEAEIPKELPIIYTPVETPTESPAARAKRLAKETEAKSAQKKADKEHRYKKSYRRPPKKRKPSDDGWGDLIEAKPRKKSKHIKRKKIAGIDTIITTRRPKKGRSSPRKKAGFGDTFFSAAERGWKRIEAGRAKRKAYHETEEYKQRQEERAQRRAEGVREFKEQAKHVEHDVKEGYKQEKKKWTNEKVSGPGYDWAGHPIKGNKTQKKPEPNPQQEPRGEDREDSEE